MCEQKIQSPSQASEFKQILWLEINGRAQHSVRKDLHTKSAPNQHSNCVKLPSNHKQLI